MQLTALQTADHAACQQQHVEQPCGQCRYLFNRVCKLLPHSRLQPFLGARHAHAGPRQRLVRRASPELGLRTLTHAMTHAGR